jgi:Histidine phosphatase superfamily (branch 1)
LASTLLYLVRHGAHQHPPAGDPDPGLSPLGEQQARLLGPRLADVPFDVLLHSPLRRTTQTARILSGYVPGVPVRSSDLLRDRTAMGASVIFALPQSHLTVARGTSPRYGSASRGPVVWIRDSGKRAGGFGTPSRHRGRPP